jgi:hypothetical protein
MGSMIEDAIRTYEQFEDRSTDPSTPASGHGLIYFKDGKIHSIDDAGAVTEYGAGGGGGGVLGYESAAGTTDQTLSNDTVTDLTSLSVSLAAGTWLVMGKHVFERSSGSPYSVLRLTDGSNNTLDQSKNVSPNAGFTYTHTVMAIVTPGSTTTYKLRGSNNTGGTWRHNVDSQGNSSKIVAVRLA